MSECKGRFIKELESAEVWATHITSTTKSHHYGVTSQAELVLNSSFSDIIITSYSAVIMKGLKRGRPGPGLWSRWADQWRASWPGPGCLQSWPLTRHSFGVSVGFRDNSVSSSGIFICHIMFHFRWLFDLPERANWFIWPTQGPVFTQCAVYSNSPGPAHSDLVTGCCQSRGESQTVMLSCHHGIMTTWQRHDQHVMAVMDQRLDLIVSKSVGYWQGSDESMLPKISLQWARASEHDNPVI